MTVRPLPPHPQCRGSDKAAQGDRNHMHKVNVFMGWEYGSNAPPRPVEKTEINDQETKC